jgi:hypothetical protein
MNACAIALSAQDRDVRHQITWKAGVNNDAENSEQNRPCPIAARQIKANKRTIG